MIRYLAWLLPLVACVAGCGQNHVTREPSAQEQAERQEKAVEAIHALGGDVRVIDVLPGCPVEVDFAFSKITDSDLKELKGLMWLNLDGTQITEAGLKDLRQALPSTQTSGP